MPKPELLEIFPNPYPGRDYEIAMECPEFTALCPLGGIESDADDLRALRGQRDRTRRVSPVDMSAPNPFRDTGLRWIWIATLGFSVLGLLLLPISGSVTWHGVAEGAIGIGLLLMPSTRRYRSRVARTVAIR